MASRTIIVCTRGGNRARTAKRDAIDRALARELGLEHEQLELAIHSSDVKGSQGACPECGRWNYHIATCSRRPMP